MVASSLNPPKVRVSGPVWMAGAGAVAVCARAGAETAAREIATAAAIAAGAQRDRGTSCERTESMLGRVIIRLLIIGGMGRGARSAALPEFQRAVLPSTAQRGVLCDLCATTVFQKDDGFITACGRVVSRVPRSWD